MNKKLIGLIDKYFIRDPWKRARFYKKHDYLHAIGDDCYIAEHIWGQESYLISVGSNVWITSGVQMINHDASVQVVQKAIGYHGIDKVGVIRIGDNVFIGNNCVLLPGIEIGNNCIIGAGSVVTCSIPDNSVAAGNPAKVIMTFDKYAEKCIEHSDQYPWLWAKSEEEVFEGRMEYFWEKGNLK